MNRTWMQLALIPLSCGLILLFAAWNTDNNYLLYLGCLTLAFAGYGTLLPMRSLQTLQIALCPLPDNLDDMHPVVLLADIAQTGWMTRHEIQLELSLQKNTGTTNTLTIPLPPLPRGNYRIELPTIRLPRGRYQPDTNLLLRCSFPFSFFQAQKSIPTITSPLLVRPYRFPVMTRNNDAGISHNYRPIQSRPFSGHDSEFFGVREYRYGDSMRHIDWRNSARQGQLIVREFESAANRSFLFVINDSADFYGSPEKNALFEKSIRITASLADHLLAQRWPVGLLADQKYLSPASGESQRRQLADSLLEMQASSHTGYATDLARLVQQNSDRHTLVLFFNAATTLSAQMARACAASKDAGHDTWLVIFSDSATGNPPFASRSCFVPGSDVTGETAGNVA